ARAKALLDGKLAAATGAPTVAAAGEPKPVTDAKPDAKADRFVVQVGAYADAEALQQARQRVERLGLKTYIQVIDTDAGKRTRVRVGPFASRDEALAAGTKLKGAGLPVQVLSL
ncbi:MAG: SPOR domain-containing protein, partial [Rubrivivax sp.]|nr:SPOR domain-containing protein [Rubrivivax sp.]